MENLFLSEYFSKLLNYNKIPKLQIERAISPLLSIFITDLISSFLTKNDELSGHIEMILPEFPLKKIEGNQSTNIDWLLINKEKGVLLFVELKTAASSFKQEQLDEYKLIQKYIQKFGAYFLYEDLIKIRDNSNEQGKYTFILELLEPYKDMFATIKKSSVIYIVPTRTKDSITNTPVLSFSELPEELFHKYDNEWQQLRKFLISIDNNDSPEPDLRTTHQNDFDATLKPKVELISRKFNKTPELIWFGKTGEGSNPNFQIKFTDGTTMPFYYSGKKYTRVKKFDPSRLRGPYEIKNLFK